MPKHYADINEFLSAYHVDRGRTLVVGSHVYEKKPIDRRDIYQNAFGVDMIDGQGVDFVHNLEQPLPESVGKFDHIDCVSVFEHCQRPWKMAETLIKVMNPGASILLSVPFCWRVHGYPSDYWRLTTEAFPVLFPNVKWKNRGYYMDGVFRKISNRVEIDGKKYIERADCIGYGVLEK